MAGEDSRGAPDEVRRAEEERIANQGALARWAGHCARHPWRVVSTWVGIFVVLIGLNAAFHGKLINDFKIPGSDTQKATDLITAKFGGEKGAALRVVLSSPNRRLDSPGGRAVITRMLAAGKASQRSLAENTKDLQKITSPLTRDEPAVEQRPDRVLRRAVRPQLVPAAQVRDRGGREPAARDRQSGRHAGRVHR